MSLVSDVFFSDGVSISNLGLASSKASHKRLNIHELLNDQKEDIEEDTTNCEIDNRGQAYLEIKGIHRLRVILSNSIESGTANV